MTYIDKTETFSREDLALNIAAQKANNKLNFTTGLSLEKGHAMTNNTLNLTNLSLEFSLVSSAFFAETF